LIEIHGLNSIISISIKYYLHFTHKSKWISTLENYYIKLFNQHNVIIKERTQKEEDSPVWTNLWHTTAQCMHITPYCQTSSWILNLTLVPSSSLCSLLHLPLWYVLSSTTVSPFSIFPLCQYLIIMNNIYVNSLLGPDIYIYIYIYVNFITSS